MVGSPGSLFVEKSTNTWSLLSLAVNIPVAASSSGNTPVANSHRSNASLKNGINQMFSSITIRYSTFSLPFVIIDVVYCWPLTIYHVSMLSNARWSTISCHVVPWYSIFFVLNHFLPPGVWISLLMVSSIFWSIGIQPNVVKFRSGRYSWTSGQFVCRLINKRCHGNYLPQLVLLCTKHHNIKIIDWSQLKSPIFFS